MCVTTTGTGIGRGVGVPSSDDYARAVIAEGKRRDISPRGIVIALATVMVESGFPIRMWANRKVPESLALPHDAVGDDGYSVGLFQQQVRRGDGGRWWWGDAATCMDPAKSAGLFYDRLAQLDYNGTGSPGSYAQAVQQSAFPDRYDQRIVKAQQLFKQLAGGGAVDGKRPDYNEYPLWSPNNQDRGGTKIDLFLLHTQEGDGNADSLARWLGGPVGVSYHYTISEDQSDHGVTVCDVVDTDRASWSVLSANNRSINLCFAGSRASWSREQWLRRSRAIDVAAFLAVADCRKYGFPAKVIAPPYVAGAGISDHRYVTRVLKDGTHTDVGDGFPWDVFAARVAHWAGDVVKPLPPPMPPVFTHPDDAAMLREVWDQLRGPTGAGWPQLGGRTVVDSLASLHAKVDRLIAALPPSALARADKAKP